MVSTSKQRCLLIFLVLLIVLTLEAAAHQNDIQNDKPQLVQAVKSITGTRESLAITYPEGVTISVKLQGTQRLPRIVGEARALSPRAGTARGLSSGRGRDCRLRDRAGDRA